jgi:hypothetical protein
MTTTAEIGDIRVTFYNAISTRGRETHEFGTDLDAARAFANDHANWPFNNTDARITRVIPEPERERLFREDLNRRLALRGEDPSGPSVWVESIDPFTGEVVKGR